MFASKTDLRDYQILSTIGEGAFAQVFKVLRRSDRQVFAMKKCNIAKLRGWEKTNAMEEVRLLSSVKNNHVIAYEDAIFDADTQYLHVIMEYAADGDLMQVVKEHKRNGTHISESQIWKWLSEISQGLKTLHDSKIIHRDLKSENVFLTEKQVAKIGDLNVSKSCLTNQAAATPAIVGTPYYTAPEVYLESIYDTKSDIWSLGCLIYELCTLHPPFQANEIASLRLKIAAGRYERIPKNYSSALEKLIAACLTQDKYARPTCDELLEMASAQQYVKPLSNPKGDSLKRYYNAENVLQPSNDHRNHLSQQHKNRLEPTKIRQNDTSNHVSSISMSHLTNKEHPFDHRQRVDQMLESEIQRRFEQLSSKSSLQPQKKQNTPFYRPKSNQINAIDLSNKENKYNYSTKEQPNPDLWLLRKKNNLSVQDREMQVNHQSYSHKLNINDYNHYQRQHNKQTQLHPYLSSDSDSSTEEEKYLRYNKASQGARRINLRNIR